MRYLCAIHIHKTKFLLLFCLAKKKFFLWRTEWAISQLPPPLPLPPYDVKNNRFGKLNIQNLCTIYALSYPHSLNSCTATLKALSSQGEQPYSHLKSFKIAKLNSLIMQNNSLIYALLVPSIFDFCTVILKALSSQSTH